ncbi:MAG: hypothetical protein V3V22_10230 [Methylococcales bacterium]
MNSIVGATPFTAVLKNTHERKLLENEQTLKNFLAYKGETFFVSGGDGSHLVEELKLVDVIDAESSNQLEMFLLRFKALNTSTLAKQVYNFEHAQAGKIRLWIEPVSEGQQKKYFDAQFTLLKNFKIESVIQGETDEIIEL